MEHLHNFKKQQVPTNNATADRTEGKERRRVRRLSKGSVGHW